MRASREYTSKLLDMMDEGLIDPTILAQRLLCWLSEDDVKEFWLAEEYALNEEEEEYDS